MQASQNCRESRVIERPDGVGIATAFSLVRDRDHAVGEIGMNMLARYMVSASARHRVLARLAGGCEFILAAMLGLLLARAIWFVAFGASATNMAFDAAAQPGSRNREASFVSEINGLPSAQLFSDRTAPMSSAVEIAAIPESRLDL